MLLYELLTGTTPFDKERLRTAAYDEIRRIIREEEPPKPSTRLSTLGQAATDGVRQPPERPEAAEPSCCRGELDWIVMKALEKDRDRRYETASAFAADVQRYLNDEPVQACPPSPWYRFRKFARRNKQVVVMASFLFALLVVGVAILGVSYAQVQEALQDKTRALNSEHEALENEQQTSYFHRIALAHSELTGNFPDPDRAETLLDACPAERRGWEWDYLKRLWRVEPVVLRDPRNAEINSVSFSPDGKHLAAACGDATVKVWDLTTDQVFSLQGHKKEVLSVAFSPTDGRRLASAGADKTVRVWDWRTGEEVFPALPGQEGRRQGTAYGVTFSPDGRRLAAASEGGIVWIRDAETGKLISPRHELIGHELMASCVAFSRDGLLLASGSWRGIVRIWDAQTGRCLYTLRENTPHPVSVVAFSPDGRSLAAGYFDWFIQVWDTTTGKPLYTLAQHATHIRGLAFSPDGRRLASAGRPTVRLWDLPAQQEVLRLRGHTDVCQCLAISPDGWLLASASQDGTIRLWDATPLTGKEGEEVLTFPEHTQEVWSVAISPDGKRIASAGLDPIVRIWDATTGRVTQTFSEITMVVFGVAFSPDGQRLAAVGLDDDEVTPFVLRVWNAQTGKTVLPPLRQPQEIRAVAFSPDGRWLALGLLDGTVKLADARTGREIGFEDKYHSEVLDITGGVTFRPDGRHLASVGKEGTVVVRDVTPAHQLFGGWRVWLPCPQAAGSAPLPLAAAVQLAVWSETSRPQPLFTLRSSEHPFVSVAYSLDSQRLVTASTDGRLTLWEAETGKEILAVREPVGRESFLAVFSPDGRWVVSASADCAVRVWDATTLKLIKTFRGHRGPIRGSLAVSRDGKFLVTGSDDKTVKVWDLTHLDRQLK